jgi:nitrogen regulatory protein PII-like uncharacterized protein
MASSELVKKQSGLCNLDYLLINLGRNRAMAQRLVSLFLENYPVLCDRMEKAVEEDDLYQLRDALHDIRSNCVLFSANVCVELVREMESLVRDRMNAAQAACRPVDWKAKAIELRENLDGMALELSTFLAA